MAANPITQRDEFLEQRRLYVGGSDVGSIMGMGPYACPLRVFNDKIGAPKTNAFFGNKFTERGLAMEPFVAKMYADKLTRQVRKAVPKAHRLYPRLRPQSDYEVVNSAGLTVKFPGQEPLVLDESWGPGVISIKAPGMHMFKKFQYEGPNEEYILQLQYELACWNRKWGSFAIFNGEIWELLHYDVPYDPEIGEAAVTAANQFIAEHLDRNVAPEKLKIEAKACARCEYLVACQGQELLAMGIDGDERPAFEFVNDPVLARTLAQVVDARQTRKQAEELEQEVAAEAQALLGERLSLECPNPEDPAMKLRIHFKPQAGRESFQWAPCKKALAKENPEVLAKLQKYVSQSKPSRPLRIYSVPLIG